MTTNSEPVDANQVLAVRRSLLPRRSVASQAGTVYVVLFALGLIVALSWGFWQRLAASLADVGGSFRLIWGPAGVLLLSLAILRYSIWQGFVSFSEPDCAYLLTAPIRREGLVRPRLRSAALLLGAAGGVLGVVAGLVSNGAPAWPLRSVLGAAAGFALGVILVAAGWQVQRLPRISLWLMRLTIPALAVSVLLAMAERAGGVWRLIALWSGPWGWTTLPLAGESWATRIAGLALVCALAGAGWISLGLTAGKSPLESFRRRAEARSRVVAGAYSFDARAILLATRQTSSASWRVRIRLPAPRGPRAAVPWHGLLMLLRSPLRLGWGMALGGVGVVLLTMFPARLSAALGGALALYLAAGALLEPLRFEVDSPSVSRILLPWTFGEVLWLHCLVPGAILIGEGLVAIAVVWITGAAAEGAAATSLALLVPIMGVMVMAAALSGRRGGRLPVDIVLLTAGDTTGFSMVSIIGWIVGWVLLAVVAVTIAVRALALAGPTVENVLLVAAVFLVLAEILRRLLLRPRR